MGRGRSRTRAPNWTRKRLDAVVVNDISQPGIGFDSPENEVTIITGGGERHLRRAGKGEIAGGVLEEVHKLLSVKESDDRTHRAGSYRPAGV